MIENTQIDTRNRPLCASKVMADSGPVIGSSVLGHSCGYNSAKQRSGVTLANGSYWFCDYDPLHQGRFRQKHSLDQTPLGDHQFEHNLDDIGNRK
jgi:hypothetical protein